MDDLAIKQLVFDTIESIDSLVLDTDINGDLPFHSLWDAVLTYGGSAVGSAIEFHMLRKLQKQAPGVWIKGTKDLPDLYNTQNESESFELKITTSGKIIGNKTSVTTTMKVAVRKYVFIFINKDFGEVEKIAAAELSAEDWIGQGSSNVQVASPAADKLRIIYSNPHFV